MNQEELTALPDDTLLKIFGTHFHEICDNPSLNGAEEQRQNFAALSAAILRREYPVIEICRSIMEAKKAAFTDNLLVFPSNADTLLEILTTKKKLLECNA